MILRSVGLVTGRIFISSIFTARGVAMITAKDNPQIKRCIKLRDDKKERGKTRCFFAEGENMIRAALDAGVRMYLFLYTPSAEKRYGELCARCTRQAEKTLAVSEKIGGKLADAKTTQGLFAVLDFLPEKDDFSLLPDNASVVFLENLQDPGNVGTILRTALAMSIDLVVLSGCCDLYSPKVLRSTAGMIFKVPFLRVSQGVQTVEQLKKCGFKVLGTCLHGGAVPITKCVRPGKKQAVIIGNEGNGVSDELLNLCHNHIYIPMNSDVESLNAAVAAAVCIWEMKGREIE